MSTNQLMPLMAEMAVFVKVVETGSFSEAARQLGATPSAISRSVSRLEKALGLQLLQRTTRKLRLSESGVDVHQRCVDMMHAAQDVMTVSGRFCHEPQGRIRISVPKAVGRFVIHPFIPEFLAKYPKVDVHLLLNDRYMDLIDDEVDLAIRITDQPSPGLMGRHLFNIEHMLCATPEYLAQHGHPQHPKALKAHNCIFLSGLPSNSRWRFQQGSQHVSVNVHGRYAVNHTGARLDAVLQHMGIGSLPYFTARHALEQGKLIQVLPQWTFKTDYSGAAWILYPPTRHPAPSIRAFINFIAERLSHEPKLTPYSNSLNQPSSTISEETVYEFPEATKRFQAE
jgi:DNA-binding transcriptional LysR family regulator